jgi:hypothetical protein
MSKRSSLYKRHRFPPEIIQHVVWLYHRFNLSSRDIEELMAERGIRISYETIRLWTKSLSRFKGSNITFGGQSIRTATLWMYSYSPAGTDEQQNAS